jgi:hypothetical protein
MLFSYVLQCNMYGHRIERACHQPGIKKLQRKKRQKQKQKMGMCPCGRPDHDIPSHSSDVIRSIRICTRVRGTRPHNAWVRVLALAHAVCAHDKRPPPLSHGPRASAALPNPNPNININLPVKPPSSSHLLPQALPRPSARPTPSKLRREPGPAISSSP